MYENGYGVGKNPKEAFSRYKSMASDGYPPAQYVLGTMYANGIGVAKSESSAFDWFERAADRGDAQAIYAVGRMLEGGYDRSDLKSRQRPVNC